MLFFLRFDECDLFPFCQDIQLPHPGREQGNVGFTCPQIKAKTNKKLSFENLNGSLSPVRP